MSILRASLDTPFLPVVRNLKNPRLFVAVLIAVVIATVFWSQSRVPALNEKAQMGLRTSFGDIAFEILLPLSADQGFAERVARTSVNWAYTNLQGMTFGLLFAAAVLTILSNLRRRQFKSPAMNALSGVLIGAPLGVCVNCATPIAFGIASSGARLETALASLIASPTLNVIVLTMVFTLLPVELAVLKLGGVVLLLAAIPLLVRRYVESIDSSTIGEVSRQSKSRLPVIGEAAEAPPGEPFLQSLTAIVGQFLRNLGFLFRFALPLMLLAGVLGALAIETIPFDAVVSQLTGVTAIVVAAGLATFLPVPIAFDVIIVMAMLSGGAQSGVAMALLFGLGAFSIYPAAMIGRFLSWKLSFALLALVVALSIGTGLAAQWVTERGQAIESDVITSGVTASGNELVAEAANVCETLPGAMQMACFSRHLDAFDDLIAVDSLCDYRPSAVAAESCAEALAAFAQTNEAVAAGNAEPCAVLEAGPGRSRCIYSATLRAAQRDHDVRRCDALPDRSAASRCRNDYVQASLLFNPDDSACSNLIGPEAADCRVNASIYRYADTGNIDGCDGLLPAEARDFCRYTIASTHIGRFGDAAFCERIVDPQAQARCERLPQAWRAAEDNNANLCADLEPTDLRNTCLQRVVDGRIAAILAQGITTPPADSAGLPVIDRILSPAAAPATRWIRDNAVDGVEIERAAFPGSRIDGQQFARHEAGEVGISDYWQFAITDFFEPFIIGKGIASGDYNNDGWPDVVLATERGVRLYQNTGGRFAPAPVAGDRLSEANVFLVAFVDFNGDGFQDLFASTYAGNNIIVTNVGGSFSGAPETLLKGDHRLTMAAGFGDLDNDGDIDAVLGNWSSGLEKLFIPEQSANVILTNEGGHLVAQTMNEIRGETNSVLVADVDADGFPDIVIGNDRLVPDLWYLGNGEGGFTAVEPERGLVPRTPMFTMSIDAADFDNDGAVDIFATDMTFARSSRDNYCAAVDDELEAARCGELLDAFREFSDKGASSCEALASRRDRRDCYVAHSVRAAKSLKDPRFCDRLPDDGSATRSLCDFLAAKSPTEPPVDQSRYLPQVQRNVLLRAGSNQFEEISQEAGVASSFWTWNAKAADLDNDGWQDIYVGNGFHFGENFYEIQENILFRNSGAARFEQMQRAWGLDDPLNTPSYTYIDYDLDGDLDIIATGVNAPPRVYENRIASGNAVSIQLLDERGNRFGIGATVSIVYGGGSRQTRDVRLSGGFLSFDSPVLTFGLGEHSDIETVLVRWLDGQETRIDGPLVANQRYRFHRRALH